jgi:hypothetical protein
VYPTRYQLPELTAHVVAVLERRREAHLDWSAEVEAHMADEARATLAEAGKQFTEFADDSAYWQRVEQAVLTVVLPRYFALARDEREQARNKYGVWRGGDLVSRAVYALAGLVAAGIVLRTGLPKWTEPLPLAFFIGGPLIPDLQVWFARRRHAHKLAALVEDMREEAKARDLYRPLMDGAPPAVDEHVAGGSAAATNPKHKVGE